MAVAINAIRRLESKIEDLTAVVNASKIAPSFAMMVYPAGSAAETVIDKHNLRVYILLVNTFAKLRFSFTLRPLTP